MTRADPVCRHCDPYPPLCTNFTLSQEQYTNITNGTQGLSDLLQEVNHFSGYTSDYVYLMVIISIRIVNSSVWFNSYVITQLQMNIKYQKYNFPQYESFSHKTVQRLSMSLGQKVIIYCSLPAHVYKQLYTEGQVPHPINDSSVILQYLRQKCTLISPTLPVSRLHH